MVTFFLPDTFSSGECQDSFALPEHSSAAWYSYYVSLTTTREADTDIFSFSVLQNLHSCENRKLTMFIRK